MLAKQYRLTRPSDFRRAHSGKCWPSHMLVLCKVRNESIYSRFGFSVSRHIGNAVTRNRVKRLLREAVGAQLDLLTPGWDVVMIARTGIIGADYWAIEQAVAHLLQLAGLYSNAQARSASSGIATGRDAG